MPKLVIFDLDGVLLDSCNIHYKCLNTALQEIAGDEFIIPYDKHIRDYNGLSTRTKIQRIENLPKGLHEPIFRRKQELTTECLQSISIRHDLITILETLHSSGISAWCASNCIQQTVDTSLKAMGIFTLFDGVLSNESVKHPKPSPDIYIRTMELANVSPKDTLIFEDSYTGLKAAVRSGARVWRVASPHDITVDYVMNAVESNRSNLMRDVNIVIPMAGNGSRFATAGYKDPKPFIPVFGDPMISWVVRNVGIDGHYIFVIRKEFDETYNATCYLQTLCNDSSIHKIENVTEGAACTVLLTEAEINNDRPLIIINSDQYIEFNEGGNAFDFVFDFLYNPSESGMTGKISTFDGNRHPKWSYAKTDEKGIVVEVREKDPFSDHATTGLYMWRRGSDFVTYANQMIQKNIRVNNEFYGVPVFNEAIADDHKIIISDCKRMWGIGVPEDLEFFIEHFKENHTI